ncbi:type II toxin-antitoxin system VapC family toxin [Chelativorans intermedius]|uniref:type II toxin-antitoxin system VapC family toxin n=1 Tax=Chelativorans intermedius TaxID=515947 RepID=UPI0021C0E61B|nr:type II toxin-antitoxin system VapC family toxin [Chelativorans intermedius]MCT9000747.1 type II toxin-antitoxin system VapC family toxin [Chelativorans intermedius]
MILIDTNVISELMRPNPAPAVLAWFGDQDAMALHLSAVGEAELRRGAAALPDGKRRERLIAEIDAMIAEDFAGRVLPFDSAAAKAFAAIFMDRRNAGRPISFTDCQIAATARAYGAAIATRNVADFEGCGVEVIDPWADTASA